MDTNLTIFFSGHTFKYELEGIAKLFFPVVRFQHKFDDLDFCKKDAIITRMKVGRTKTYFGVRVSINGQSAHLSKSIENSCDDYKSECERWLCVLLFKLLQQLTGITPRWGILTGIRPVATVQKMRRKGMTDYEIKTYLKEKYLVTDSKLDLAFLTADNQAMLLTQVDEKSYSLYVSIPFCPSRCSYCSFVSHAINTPKSMEKVDDYVMLLCDEIAYTAKVADELKLELETIYIGGGTPTALSAKQLEQVTNAIFKCFDVPSVKEYTIEAGRADTITREKLEVIKNAGATRISVNPQTFCDDVLQTIGRKHTANEVVESYQLAKGIGFESINMDFIAGLPSDTLEGFQASIDKAIELAPTNITVHTLSIKRSSDLFSDLPELKADYTLEMTEYAQTKLIQAGYQPYYLYRQKNTIGNLENVGYSKKGFESLYNVYIMDEIQTILACGAGGTTKLVRVTNQINASVSEDETHKKGMKPIERIFNYKYHFEYINQFDEILRRKDEVKSFYETVIF